MARLPRIVIPGLPHHVTQRGNGRAQTFFGDDGSGHEMPVRNANRSEPSAEAHQLPFDVIADAHGALTGC